ncbi:hypothetical protein BD309DRAFT_893027 [Dichomitus squalens]|uniref:Rhodanese domain-containing protein n=1 Tax=Dichomitus squalens TaxID=114155 RepID=A0A4Q9NX23_9APHY|nr:hypothetical protein BD311DRAFT_380717 [Dichomitus squalens]TBU44166.1 hypothetical protein BD309DRAFT_893027 [Dichomitus squalens]TBU54241.1 hypothetical protein BD310DRAFT_936323 [Dichomitus squalens]
MSSSRSRSSRSHQRSSSDVSSSRSTSTYGQVIERPFRLPSVSDRSEGLQGPSTMSQTPSRSHSNFESESGSRSRSSSASRPAGLGNTFDPIRDQVAHTIVVRATYKAETIDGTKVGVILTLPHDAGEQFLKVVASRLKRAMTNPKVECYLFILALPTQGLSPLLICSSDEQLSERAGLLVNSKFLNRIARHELRHGRWGALVRDLCTTTYDEAALWDAVRKAARKPIDPLIPPPGSRSISQVLERARARLQRITPEQALHELQDIAPLWPVVLVDIRPEAQRKAFGSIAGALIIERNVLEWRFDPRCAARLPIADRYDLRVIIFCQESYTSSLAAASLHDLGMLNATDMIGGYAAWKEAGLPDEVEVSSTAPPTEGRVSVPVEE